MLNLKSAADLINGNNLIKIIKKKPCKNKGLLKLKEQIEYC